MRKKSGTRRRRASGAQDTQGSAKPTRELPISKRVRLPDGRSLLVGNMSMRGELVGFLALLSKPDTDAPKE